MLEAAGVDNDRMRQVAEDGQRLVRERPALALGGAAAVGLLMGRFWKLRLLRIALPAAAFAAGFFAERLVGQSDEPMPAAGPT